MANLKHSEFDTKIALRAQLNKLFSEITAIGDYNLYLHKVYDFDSEGKRYGNICARTNFNGIMERGLNLNKYSTLQQTSVFHGPIDGESANDVIKYDYPWPTTEHIVVILAIPATMDIGGKAVNLSTPIFRFAEYGIMGEDRGIKNQFPAPFDALRYYSVDTSLILGAIVTHLPTETEADFEARGGKYELILNTDHITQVDEATRETVLEPIRARMITTFGLDESESADDMANKHRPTMVEMDKYNAMAGTHDDFYDFD